MSLAQPTKSTQRRDAVPAQQIWSTTLTQRLFDFDDDTPDPAPAPTHVALTRRQALVEQVIRDTKVVEGNPIYHEPSLDFYVQRVVAYRRELEKI